MKDHPIFLHLLTREGSCQELKNVVEMIMDYHLEQINAERLIRNELTALQEQKRFNTGN
ncbi:MAG: hypothetical protein Ct9H300mP21_08520 [Pseudomonadota bacterium]|nr:MAG: hypothetical protein Ct9H300mP21_08520 [Pseudomonadota bacterium]